MAGKFDRSAGLIALGVLKLRRRVAVLSVFSALSLAAAQGELRVGFGGDEDCSMAFVVSGGREAVSLGVAGKNLASAQLRGVSTTSTSMVADPVSRLVIFKTSEPWAGGLMLAENAPLSGNLTLAGTKTVARIVARVEQVGGKYLPFTLIKLSCVGHKPVPGTPLLDARGKVAALVYDQVGKGAVLYALPVEVLQRALKQVRKGRKIQRTWLGIVLNPASGTPKVSRIVEGSPASAVGIRKDDVLLEIGGRRVTDYGDAVNAFFLLTPGAKTMLKIRRGSSEIVLVVVPQVVGLRMAKE